MWIQRMFVTALLALAGISAAAEIQTRETVNPWLGTWSGSLRCGAESKMMSLRLELDKDQAFVMFLSLPDMKFHDLGPVPLKQDGSQLHSRTFSLRLGPDNTSLSGTWALDGNDLSFELKPGPLTPEAPAPLATGRTAQPVWTFKTGGAIWSSPAVADGAVYFGSSDGLVYALTAVSGKPQWQFKTGGPVMGRPTVDGPHLYVLSDDGFLYKLDRKTGKSIWQFDTHGGGVARDLPSLKSAVYDAMTSAATVVGGVVYIGSADKRVYAVDADAGTEKWHFETGGIVRSTLALADGRVFLGSYDHFIYALDAKTGALQWKYDTLREVVSSPLVLAGTVYIGSRCSDLFAFDAVTGKVRWKYFYWSSWVESSAAARDGILYVGSSDYQQLFAIDAASGKKLWNFNTDGSAWSTPAVTDRMVFIGAVGVPGYFIEHHGGFFAVDRATGKPVWHYPMPPIGDSAMYGVASSPATGEGMVFFGGLDGVFYSIRMNG